MIKVAHFAEMLHFKTTHPFPKYLILRGSLRLLLSARWCHIIGLSTFETNPLYLRIIFKPRMFLRNAVAAMRSLLVYVLHY